jgi:hypothetical protein
MAKLKCYAVFDSKVQEFAQPFFLRSRGEALRGWQTVANDPSTDICKYAEDFSCFELAEFDATNGTFNNIVPPFNLGLAATYKTPTGVRSLEGSV